MSRFGCATALTLAALAQNAIFGVLASDVVTRKAVVAAAAFMLPEGCRRLARWLEDWDSAATMFFRSPGCFPQRFAVEAYTAGLEHLLSDPGTLVPSEARPRLPRGVRLVHNEAQGGWILLAPERVFKADAIAAEIIKRRCIGEVAFAELVDELAKSYAAAREEILADVGTLLRGVADRLVEL